MGMTTAISMTIHMVTAIFLAITIIITTTPTSRVRRKMIPAFALPA